VGDVTPPGDEPAPVDTFLDRLFDLLGGSGAAGRRAFAEAEDHLRQATAEGVARGLSRVDAERAAVKRFGTPEQFAAGLRPVSGPAGLRAVARQVFAAGWLLGGIGMVSIGLSGALAAFVAAVYGKDLVAADKPTDRLSPERCEYLLAGYPSASSCHAASVAHHTEEIVRNGLTAGVLGVLALVVFQLARRSRRFARFRPLTVLPPAGMTAAVGTAVFGLAGAVLVESAMSRLNAGERWGAGYSLVSGLATIPAFLLCAVWAFHEIRHRLA
jgi:hypothetical protein